MENMTKREQEGLQSLFKRGMVIRYKGKEVEKIGTTERYGLVAIIKGDPLAILLSETTRTDFTVETTSWHILYDP